MPAPHLPLPSLRASPAFSMRRGAACRMQRAWAVCAVQEGSSDTYRSLFISVGLPRTRLVTWLPSSFIMRSPGAAAYLFVFMRLCAAALSEIAPMRYPPLRRVSGRRSRSSCATWRSSKQAWPASKPASKRPQPMTTRTSRQRRPPPRRRGRPRQPSRACRRTCAFCPRGRSTHSGRSSRTLPRV